MKVIATVAQMNNGHHANAISAAIPVTRGHAAAMVATGQAGFPSGLSDQIIHIPRTTDMEHVYGNVLNADAWVRYRKK